MILKYLWDKNLTYGAYNFKGMKHLTINKMLNTLLQGIKPLKQKLHPTLKT